MNTLGITSENIAINIANVENFTVNQPMSPNNFKKLVLGSTDKFNTHIVVEDTIGIPYEIFQISNEDINIHFLQPVPTDERKILALLHIGSHSTKSSLPSDENTFTWDMPSNLFGNHKQIIEITFYN